MQVGRPHRGRGARAGHDQSGEAAAHRQPRRLARSRQGRRRRRSGTIIRSAPTPSPIASTSTARSTTTASRTTARLTELDEGEGGLAAAEQGTTRRAARRRRNRRRAASGSADRRAGRQRPRPAARRQAPAPARAGGRDGPVWAITNARFIRSRGPDIERGTIVIRGNKIEAVGAERAGAGRRDRSIDAAGADVYPGFINARTHDRAQRARRRAASTTSTRCSTSTRSSARGSRITPTATRSRSRARTASRPSPSMPGGGIVRRRGRGDESRRLDVGRSDAPAERRASTFNFPAIGGGGGRGGGGAAADAPAAANALRRAEEASATSGSTRSRSCSNRRAPTRRPAPTRPMDWTLEALVPVVERQAAARRRRVESRAGHPRRGRVRRSRQGEHRHQRRRGSGRSRRCSRRRTSRSILGNVLTLPLGEDAFHAATYQLAGELAKAGVKFAFATERQRLRADSCRTTRRCRSRGA